ncbi:hypothetical protein CEXT_773251 [Caerostris extrusa]|uniref:Uncharacterized protein n=1 Tax=Caerostris extrusa TaxID=172846 RepID=A0AAV4X078_CAEEX|nr:hypothetical protein CEXT_773251 [Caerostris extrusa]
MKNLNRSDERPKREGGRGKKMIKNREQFSKRILKRRIIVFHGECHQPVSERDVCVGATGMIPATYQTHGLYEVISSLSVESLQEFMGNKKLEPIDRMRNLNWSDGRPKPEGRAGGRVDRKDDDKKQRTVFQMDS